MKKMYYLISYEYVGPNDRDSSGNFIRDTRTIEITTKPGRTNMSHQVLIDGWLGTTNDNASYAHGEYSTIEAARDAAKQLGYTVPVDDYLNQDRTVVEVYATSESEYQHWDAGDWLNEDNIDITAKTTNAELEEMAKNIEAEAYEQGDNPVVLHGCYKHLEYLRDKMIDTRDRALDMGHSEKIAERATVYAKNWGIDSAISMAIEEQKK